MPRRRRRRQTILSVVVLTLGLGAIAGCADDTPRWLAGDHHVHSHFSVGWDHSTDPPTPVLGQEGIYPIPMNAVVGREFGLEWMVSTDHGGPNHSKVNLEWAYPELLASREAVPDVVQFYGMELDTPGAEHSSLIVPHTHDEADRLHELESGFNRREPHPPDPAWDTEQRMLDALATMREMDEPPVLIANHPARSAPAVGIYGPNTPDQLRDWNDTAPRVATGMEGAPGHQAHSLNPDGSLDAQGARGGYAGWPTMGGFDPMTATLGGFWDSMLGEGRRWWITSSSDSHVNWREGGWDFWPGEYSKTYVLARKNHDAILESIRAGRVFVTTGDLISELWVTVEDAAGRHAAGLGERLSVPAGSDVHVTIRFLDPVTRNANGQNPAVSRVDLIVGRVTGPARDRALDQNPSTRVEQRFLPGTWERRGRYQEIRYRLRDVDHALYLRVRGTNTDELEPTSDDRGEDPWSDLWFYSNPIFVDVDASR